MTCYLTKAKGLYITDDPNRSSHLKLVLHGTFVDKTIILLNYKKKNHSNRKKIYGRAK